MRMQMAKWATAVLAASTFGVVGCESSKDDETSGTTAADATDATTATDSADSTDSADAADATEAGDGTESADSTDTTDVADSTDGTDGTDATDSVGTDAPDGVDSPDGDDGCVDATDCTDGTDGVEADDGEPVDECNPGSKINEGQCCTCSGANCEKGIDNSLAGIAGLANSPLQESIDKGSVNLIAEFNGDLAGEFTLNMYTADLPAETECDVATASCDWVLSLSSFTADTCKPLISFNDAKIHADNTFTAGGPDGLFLLSLPIQGFVLELKVIGARIAGNVTKEGDKITGFSGILAGAVPKAALEEAVDKLPEEGLPIPKAQIKSILGSVVKSDIDGLDATGEVGQDGVKESASVSIKFEAIPGNITAVEAYTEPKEGEAPKCATPPLLETFSDTTFRLSSLSLGDSGKEGEALDVDGVCVEPNATPAEPE